MKFFLITISILLLLPNFFNVTLEEKPGYNKIEIYNPSLSSINSVQKLIDYSDSISQKKYAHNSLEYAMVVSNVLEQRFYHGFSVYSLQKDWIAAVTQYLVGHDVANPVNPEDILKYPYAGCSQQAIVLTAVMKRNKVHFRSLGFPHHYTTELQFNNSWYYFDTDMEPDMSEADRNLIYWKHDADSLKKFYHKNPTVAEWAFGNSQKAIVGKIDAEAAPNASLFQNTTKYLSKLLWVFPLIIVAYPRKKKK